MKGEKKMKDLSDGLREILEGGDIDIPKDEAKGLSQEEGFPADFLIDMVKDKMNITMIYHYLHVKIRHIVEYVSSHQSNDDVSEFTSGMIVAEFKMIYEIFKIIDEEKAEEMKEAIKNSGLSKETMEILLGEDEEDE